VSLTKKKHSSQKENKEERLYIRATKQQKSVLQEKATSAGMNLSSYLLAVGMGTKLPLPIPPVNKAVYLELCRQGNHLVRLTKENATNTDAGFNYRLHPDDRATLTKLYQLLVKIQKLLEGKKKS
jgi:hypothetical protein